MITFIDKCQLFKDGKKQFTMILDDPMDNSFIQNPFHPKDDPNVIVELYKRTYE